MTTPNIIPLSAAVICQNCICISDSTGDTCAFCKAVGSLLTIGRILNPEGYPGRINYFRVGEERHAEQFEN